MSDVAIFIAGLVVTIITLSGTLIIGLAEAADPAHSRPEDLQEFERKLVDRPETSEAEESLSNR